MKVFFVSLGCDKNLVDSEVMLGLLAQSGHNVTYSEEEADLFVVNTCGFISDATKESIDNILRIVELKTENQKLIVTGCMVSRYKDDILRDMPEVDEVLTTDEFKTRLEEESGRRDSQPRQVSTGHFAYLKIADGCDNFCAYCTIPSIRGPYKSREPDSLIEEAKSLAQGGVRELILVAQDTSLYGSDLKTDTSLAKLIRGLSEISGIEWIRVMYAYPEHISEEFIDEIASNPKLVKYLDMPVQHCNDEILKAMRRGGSRQRLVDIIQNLRKRVPDIALRTTLITGLPGETDEIFDELYKFVEECRFDRLGVFAYSKEAGTDAAKMKGQVNKSVKESRRDALMKLQQDISLGINQEKVGKTFRVITDGYLPEDGVYCGRTSADAYEVDGMVFFDSEITLNSGDFVDVKITNASEYDLEGVCVSESAQ